MEAYLLCKLLYCTVNLPNPLFIISATQFTFYNTNRIIYIKVLGSIGYFCSFIFLF